MSSEQPVKEKEPVAVAFLVESSLSIAQEWRRKISEYSSSVLKRLNDIHGGQDNTDLRVAFVTYGFADTVPSPILCKRFFSEFKLVFDEMEDLSRLGIGMTNSGGSRGMAALEGFVAALELFDILQNSWPMEGTNKAPDCHIIHIADSSPDASQHPSWNDSTSLDNVDWDSLPAEIKRRNIQLTTVNLRPNLSRFPELHAAVVTGGSTPWFNVLSPHAIFLATLPAPPQPKASPTKRPGDLVVERPPEAKRPRLQPNKESPKPAAKTIAPQVQSIVPPISVAQAPRPAQPVTVTQPPPATTNATPFRISHQEVLQRIKVAGDYLRELESRIKAAKSEGKTALAESLMQEYTEKNEKHTKITQVLNHQVLAARQAAQAQQAQNNLSQNPAYPQREIVAPSFGLNNGTSSLSTGNLPSSSLNPSVGSDLNGATQMQHSRSLSETNLTSPNMPNAPLGAMNMSMQKTIEQQQQQRLRPTPMETNQPMGGIPNQNIAMHPNPPQFNAVAGPNQPPQPQQAANAKKNVTVWSGSLLWSGQGTSGVSKLVSASVVANSTNPAMCHSNTWPQNLSLAPAGRQVPMNELQEWMKRHQPAVVTFKVQPSAQPDFKTNENNYVSFVQLLSMKNIYATASWPTPKGGQTKNALIFPVGTGLAGAFFPLTGLPELPKPMAVPALAPPLNPAPSFNLPPSIAAQLQNLNAQQRAVVINQLQRHRQQQAALAQQQQQQQQQLPRQDVNGAAPFNPATHSSNHANMNAVLNMMNSQGPGAMGNTPQPTFPNTMPRLGLNNPNGGVQGNVSYEMIQSFLQRNSDGGGNMNPQS